MNRLYSLLLDSAAQNRYILKCSRYKYFKCISNIALTLKELEILKQSKEQNAESFKTPFTSFT